MLYYFKEYVVSLWNLTLEMSPYLLLGFFIAGLLYVYFPKQKVSKYLGKNNIKSVINAALLGVPLPLCSCGVIPTGISFYKNGASKGSCVSFLISTPQTGIDSIMVTYALLGWPLAVIKTIIALITGIIGGAITNSTEKKDPANKIISDESSVKTETTNKVKSLLNYAFVEFLEDIAKWLIIGLLIAALMDVIIPEGFFTTYLGNEYVSMLVILIASILTLPVFSSISIF